MRVPATKILGVTGATCAIAEGADHTGGGLADATTENEQKQMVQAGAQVADPETAAKRGKRESRAEASMDRGIGEAYSPTRDENECAYVSGAADPSGCKDCAELWRMA
jgi:hypothetical protein